MPRCFTTCSNLRAVPVGRRVPRSHWLTVFTATLRKPASTAWLTPTRSRTSAISDGDKSATDVASELGIKLGQEIAKNFYGRREFKS